MKSLLTLAMGVLVLGSVSEASAATVRLNFIGGIHQHSKGTVTAVVARHVDNSTNLTLLVSGQHGTQRTQCAINLSHMRPSEVIELAKTLQSGAVEAISCVARTGIDAERELIIGADRFMLQMKMN